jgi:uncharacterized protein YdeI (YjbR/CyaY-like superfamily)
LHLFLESAIIFYCFNIHYFYKKILMQPIFFSSIHECRKWFDKNYQLQTELIIGYYKVGAHKKTITWSQSVDVALCYGWIDGVRKSIDAESYQIRFTPRRVSSVWSAVNIAKVNVLIKNGLMLDAGLRVFNLRKAEHLLGYTFNTDEIFLSEEYEKTFKANKKAWNYFQLLAPTYRKPSINWVMTAKQETTRLKRLVTLIADSEKETNQWKHNKYTQKK